MEKETLEELGKFAERKYLERLNNYEKCDFKDGVIEGAKWQQEAILDLLKVNGYEDDPIFDLITEQFKKK
jgi:hypothetical protein